MSLSVDFLDFRLKNPLMLTEGPLSGTKELIEKASRSAAGLIFTKGIRPKAALSPVPYIRKYQGSLLNADWSCIGFEQWIDVIHSLDIETPLVASIAKNYVTPDQAVEMAEKLVQAGSRAVSFVDYKPVQLSETVKIAKRRLTVPVMVKLPPFLPDLEEVLTSLVSAGVDAIAAMDSVGPVLSINAETGEPLMGSPDGSAYLSGKYILPVALKYIYEIARFVDVPVVGVGGVTGCDSALQMIMAGATGVGMVTTPMLKGLEVFSIVENGLIEYCTEKSIEKLSSIRGLTRKKIRERKTSLSVRAEIDPLLCTSCGACRSVCYSLAINPGVDSYSVRKDTCVGCGLCDSVCPAGAVSFGEW